MQGLRRAVAIAVGEKHSIALQGFWVPRLPTKLDVRALARGEAAQARGELSPQSSGDSGGAHDVACAGSMGGLMRIARSPAPPQCVLALPPQFATHRLQVSAVCQLLYMSGCVPL